MWSSAKLEPPAVTACRPIEHARTLGRFTLLPPAAAWVAGGEAATDTLSVWTGAAGYASWSQKIAAAFDRPTLALMLTGVATKAEYSSALQAVLFGTDSHDPSSTTRIIHFTVDDGAQQSAPMKVQLAVFAENDALRWAGGNVVAGAGTGVYDSPAVTYLEKTGAAVAVAPNASLVAFLHSDAAPAKLPLPDLHLGCYYTDAGEIAAKS